MNAETSFAGMCQAVSRQRVSSQLARINSAKERMRTSHDSQWNEAYIEWCEAGEELRSTVMDKLGVSNGELALLVEHLS